LFSAWHIIRATGLTAYVLLFLITACGLLLSMRLLPVRYRSVVISLHGAAALACLFVSVVHVIVLLLNKHMPFSLADVLLPFWTEDPAGEIATGIFAFYVLLIVTISSVSAIMKIIGAKLWRSAHYLAFPCFWFALYHGLTIGTDSNSPFILLLYAVTGGAAILLTLLRTGMFMWKRGIADEYSARGR
jgi:hypothetical protein